jgi:hypothetical protein
MHLTRNPDPRPLGVPLDDLEKAIGQTNLKALRDGSSLIVQNENLITRIDVIAPANRECGDATIKAIVQIRTELPKVIADLPLDSKITGAFNRMATLGALTFEKDRYFIGSRLTIYEREGAWKLHRGILLSTAILAADSLLGAIRRMLTKEEPLSRASAWTAQDFNLVGSHLSKICVCSTGDLRLTSQLSLRGGNGSAMFGDHRTALWRMIADQPHPALGGGLLGLLELPHRIADESRIALILNRLNQMGMAPNDLPPHFGAWHPGNLGDNPAYISFYPNVMHHIEGIALNASIWALHRAEWADAALASLGVRL